MSEQKPQSKLRKALAIMNVETAPPPPGPSMLGLATFNAIPVTMPGLFAYTGITPAPSTDIHIPGVPRLYSRGKDSRLFNTVIDHFGVVFATGPNGEPQPNDLVFELQLWTGHRLIRYHTFCNGELPILYNINPDSKDKIIARLSSFYERPKRWRLWFNCEHFARWIMSGREESKQNEKAIEVTMVILESTATALAKMAEAQRKYEEDERRRELETARLVVHQNAATPTPPPPVVMLALQKPIPAAKSEAPAAPLKASKKKQSKSGTRRKKRLRPKASKR